MPQGSKGKELAYSMWLAKKTLPEIQEYVCARTGDKPASVKGWVLDWERGKQGKWDPTIKYSKHYQPVVGN